MVAQDMDQLHTSYHNTLEEGSRTQDFEPINTLQVN